MLLADFLPATKTGDFCIELVKKNNASECVKLTEQRNDGVCFGLRPGVVLDLAVEQVDLQNVLATTVMIIIKTAEITQCLVKIHWGIDTDTGN